MECLSSSGGEGIGTWLCVMWEKLIPDFVLLA